MRLENNWLEAENKALKKKNSLDKTLKKINAEVQKFYRRFNCPIIKTDYNTAEIIKISINLYLFVVYNIMHERVIL